MDCGVKNLMWQNHNKKQSIEKEINQKQFLPKNLKHRFSCTGSYENSFLKTDQYQESRREGWTDAAIMLCKLNKSL